MCADVGHLLEPGTLTNIHIIKINDFQEKKNANHQ